MKRFTVYFKNESILSKAMSFPFLTLKLLLGTLGGKLISEHTSNKLKRITFEAAKRPTKADLSVGKNEILAIIPHDQGVGRYSRKGIVKKITSKKKRQLAGMAQPLTPLQVARAYNFPTPSPGVANQCIAIIELGGSINPDIIANYCKSLGVAPPQITVQCIDGAAQYSDGPDGADGEVYLDACIAAAVAPGVKMLVIFAPNSDQGFISAINAAVESPLKPCAIGISWGTPERQWIATVRNVMDVALQSAQEAGINVFVAAGDNGSSDGLSGVNVDYPASSPFAVGCGGTMLILNADGSRNSETVWGDNGATGGGVSIFYPRPAFQKDITTVGFNSRLVPDIAANASPDSGYLINVDGEDTAIGGTSAVPHLLTAWCAIRTAASGPIGNFLALIANKILATFDVLTGSNGKYKAGPGFDLCSGRGVPGTIQIEASPSQNSSWLQRLFQFF